MQKRKPVADLTYNREPGDLTFVKVSNVIDPVGMRLSNANLLGLVMTKALNHRIFEGGYLLPAVKTLYAYATSEDYAGAGIYWAPTPWSPAFAHWNMCILKDPKGRQITAKVNDYTVDPDPNNLYNCVHGNGGLIFTHSIKSSKPNTPKLMIVHSTDPDIYVVDNNEGTFNFKPDWIFDLPELLLRIESREVKSTSVLVLTDSEDGHQCRDYVIKDAIMQGWNDLEFRFLVNFLATGRVVFAPYPGLEVPTVEHYREFSVSELAKHLFNECHCPLQYGFQIGDNICDRLVAYMKYVQFRNKVKDSGKRIPSYHFNEKASPIVPIWDFADCEPVHNYGWRI